MLDERSAFQVERRERRMGVPEHTDEDLMTALCEGTECALADLVHRYQNDIFRFCLHYVRNVEQAKEIAQETFVRVYVARNRFDARRSFRPWVLRIARNLCLNDLKRKKAVTMESLEEYASSARSVSGTIMADDADSPDRQLMVLERRRLLAQALDSLDDASREIVVLRFMDRLPAREIAEIVGCSEGAVRTRLHRILKTLRTRYESVKDKY